MDPIVIGVSVAAGAGAVALALVLAARREAKIRRELKFKDDLRKIREALARHTELRAREAAEYPEATKLLDSAREASKPKPRKSSAPRTKRGSGSIVADTPDLDSFVPVGVAWPPPQVTPPHSSGHSGDSHTSHHSSSHHDYGSSHSSGGYDGGSSSTSSSDSGGSSGGSSD